MSALIYDALASTDVNNLLHRAVDIIAGALATGHVLVQDLSAIDTDSHFSSSIGWGRNTAVGLGESLVALLRKTPSGELTEVTPDDDRMQGTIHVPSAGFLERHKLGVGIFVIVPCGDGILAGFVGRPEPVPAFTETEVRSFHAIMNLLSLVVDRERAELVHFRNLRQVVEAKHQWETTLDALPQLVCLIDENGCVIRTNRTLEAWELGKVVSVRGKQVHDVIHPDCGDRNCKLKAKCVDMWQQLANDEFAESVVYDQLLQRDLRFSMSRGGKSHYRDDTGEEGYALLVIEDVSQRKQAERVLRDYNKELEKRLQERSLALVSTNIALMDEIQGHLRDASALRESEKKYTCLVETTLTGLYVMQEDRIIFCNKRFMEIFGYTQEEISTLDMQQLFPRIDSAQGALPAGPTSNTEWVSREQIVAGITRDGRRIWLQRNLIRVECLNETMIMGNVIDITEQKNSEDALRHSRHELQVLSEKLLQAQEAERKRIASELHDSVGQSISAIKFGAENALQEYGDILPASGRSYLEGAIEKLRDTIDEVRRISMNLRPSMLDDLGLRATISWFTREFSTLFPDLVLDTSIEVEEGDLSDAQKVVIFRVIQESLNNIAKHAEASNVSVELLNTGGVLALSVKDNGKGFSTDAIYTGQGFGLSSMRERVKLAGGEFTIESMPDAGTLVHATWVAIH